MNAGHALAATPQKSLSVPEDIGGALPLPVLLYSKPDGVVLSASQISTWDRCKRRWAFEYIWKIRTPPHPSAILGTKVHAHLEAWLRDGTAPLPRSQDPVDAKAATIAKRMITTLIKHGIQPGQGAVERRFWIRSARGIYYTGFIDWSGWVLDELGNLATVTDHKTSGNIEAYGKTEADLHTDIQALLYAIVGMVGFGVDTIRLFWNYGETKGRHPTKAVKTMVRLPVVYDRFDIIDEEAVTLVQHRMAGTDPRTFPGNPDACGDFGGCPHKGVRCVLTPEEQLGGLMNTQNGGVQSMADRMAAMTGQQPPQGGPPNQGFQQQQGFQPPQGVPQPPQGAPPQQQQQFASPPQVAAPAQQAYSPNTGPNPPETGYGQPQQAPQQQQMPPQGQQMQGQMPPQGQQTQQTQWGPQPGQQQAPQGQQQLPHTQGQQQAAPTAEEPEETKGKSKGKGRPKGAKNKNKLNHEEVFMIGVQGLLSNANFNPMAQEAAAQIDAAGELAVQAYRRRFEG